MTRPARPTAGTDGRRIPDAVPARDGRPAPPAAGAAIDPFALAGDDGIVFADGGPDPGRAGQCR